MHYFVTTLQHVIYFRNNKYMGIRCVVVVSAICSPRMLSGGNPHCTPPWAGRRGISCTPGTQRCAVTRYKGIVTYSIRFLRGVNLFIAIRILPLRIRNRVPRLLVVKFMDH
jgi:hypothetical protein